MAASIEREMSRHQRGLVDTCFEEGQYKAGIAALDQLRSPSFSPPADHVRQLLYIALFPPGDQAVQEQTGSPTKQKPTVSYSPSVAESDAAQRVLFSFLATNSPGSLFRALPRYPSDDIPPVSSDGGHDEDSLIARESLCIANSKNCWAILKEGFIQRKKLLPQDARKKRARGAYDVEDADLDQGRGTPAVVAEHAWPVLQWLLSLFEKDELLHGKKSGGGSEHSPADVGNNTHLDVETFSPLLLPQIPPPRGGTGPRWDAAAPLDITFHSLAQEDGERRGMAARLLSLLINLDLSEHFDGPMFATALVTRFYTSTPQTVQSLMESLPKTIPILTFKIVVCQKYLSSAPAITGGTKPRPRPLPRHGSRRDLETTPSTADTHAGQAGPSVSLRPVPACSDIFQLLSNNNNTQTPTSTMPILVIKYVLLVSYAHLQKLLPPAERDSGWQEALSNSGLKHVIDTAFPRDSTYHTALTFIIKFWQ